MVLEVSFRWFGRDNVWRIPQKYVTQWLEHLGFESVFLQHGKTLGYIQLYEKIKEIEKRQRKFEFCPICGSKFDEGDICTDCGYSSIETYILQ